MGWGRIKSVWTLWVSGQECTPTPHAFTPAHMALEHTLAHVHAYTQHVHQTHTLARPPGGRVPFHRLLAPALQEHLPSFPWSLRFSIFPSSGPLRPALPSASDGRLRMTMGPLALSALGYPLALLPQRRCPGGQGLGNLTDPSAHE